MGAREEGCAEQAAACRTRGERGQRIWDVRRPGRPGEQRLDTIEASAQAAVVRASKARRQQDAEGRHHPSTFAHHPQASKTPSPHRTLVVTLKLSAIAMDVSPEES